MATKSFMMGPLEYTIDESGNINKRRGHKGYVKTFPDKDGYKKFTISTPGKTYNEPLHRIVWRVWHGPIPEGMTVDHIDGDKSNNHKDNLQLMTPEENAAKGNAVHWLVTDPNGVELEVYNLKKFCKDNNLHQGHMCTYGHRKWKARKA